MKKSFRRDLCHLRREHVCCNLSARVNSCPPHFFFRNSIPNCKKFISSAATAPDQPEPLSAAANRSANRRATGVFLSSPRTVLNRYRCHTELPHGRREIQWVERTLRSGLSFSAREWYLRPSVQARVRLSCPGFGM